MSSKYCKNVLVQSAASEVCGKDGNWPIAKAGHKAKLHCEKGQRGERTRKCNNNGKWGTVISNCVNVDLDGISAQATVIHRIW